MDIIIMTNYPQHPAAIADSSFTQIRQELQALGQTFPHPNAVIIERIIHSTADFEFATITKSSPAAIEAGILALKAGCSIITDVQMIKVGISAKWTAKYNNSLHCFVADEEAKKAALARGLTRSAIGMRIAAEKNLLNGSIVAIGNAPTALFELIQLIHEGILPALVIGVPVGFVNAVESKEALTHIGNVPWITCLGRKGGSTVAVAIIHALLRLAVGVSNESETTF